MAFHSFQFILLVLPVCYLGFLAAHRLAGWSGAFGFLAVASLAFYAQWSPVLLAILMTSVVVNYAFGCLLLKFKDNRPVAWTLLFSGIGLNLLALGYLKYANFLIDIANVVAQRQAPHIALIVPIGVSFYTFIQIGYLIEAYAGQVERQPSFPKYVLFATFFPCVTAGPLVQQREMFAQMADRRDSAFNSIALASGLTMFAMGLFKKVVFADQLAPYADAVFNAVEAGQAVASLTAWLGATCYALQLYFDFSGYSDMAVGLGCIFGLRLPLNFDSPFKATNISDFWRRWHMTMTRFFTSYIYTPMAVRGMRSLLGGEHSVGMRYLKTAAVPAIVTFLVAGVWHGAGWTFVVYGLVHGLAIAIYLGWSRLTEVQLPALVGWLLTMAVVVSALVVFRSDDLACAGRLLAAMWSFGVLGPAAGAGLVTIDVRTAMSLVVVLGSLVLLAPDTQQILHRFKVSIDALQGEESAREAGLLAWRPSVAASMALGTMLCIAVASIGAGSTFLYYQF